MECNCRKNNIDFFEMKRTQKEMNNGWENLQLPPGNKTLNKKVCTFYFMSKKFTVMHRDQRMAEQRAEEIEEGDDAIGVFKRHGRPSWDQLQ